MSKPHLVADAAIPLLDTFIGDRARLTQLPGHLITQAELREADALLVRTVTPVNRLLLQDTPVRFVGTATAGTDHIQLDDLAHPPQLYSASGANANAVAQYILCVCASLQLEGLLPLNNLRVGIIGVGHVGKRVYELLTQVGMTCVVNDPLRAATEQHFPHTELSSWRDLDVVTLHTPLTLHDPWATYHLLDEAKLASFGPDCILINTSRGEVFAADSLLQNPARRYCFDVWEHEPNIAPDCVQHATVATPHIAGYSQEAKFRASAQVYAALCEFFGWPRPDINTLLAPHLPSLSLHAPSARDWQSLVTAVFDPRRLSTKFKHALTTSTDPLASEFEALRRHYRLRREFHAYRVTAPALSAPQRAMSRALGFQFADELA